MVISAEKDTKLRRFRRMVEEATSKTEWQITASGKRVRRIDVKAMVRVYDPLNTIGKLLLATAMSSMRNVSFWVSVAGGGIGVASLMYASGRNVLWGYTAVADKSGNVSMRGNCVESKACLIEDLTTTGASAYRAAQACLAHGLTPVACLTLIDRGLGADRLLWSIGCRLVPVLTVE